MAEYRPAPDVAEIARHLISKVEQHHELVNAHIEYVFIDEAPESKGRTIWGRARKVSGLNAYLARQHEASEDGADFEPPESFFVIEISHDIWEHLRDDQRTALVDHELSHCVASYNTKTGVYDLATRSHDLEEFLGIVARHGLWKTDVQQFGIVASEQLSLAIDRIPAHAAETE